MLELLKQILSSPEFINFAMYAGIAIGAFVAKKVVDLLNQKLSAEQVGLVKTLAAQAVIAVEQMMPGATNDEKLNKALELVSEDLSTYGIKVSAQQLRAAIESAVWHVKTAQPAPPAPEAPVTEPSGDGIGAALENAASMATLTGAFGGPSNSVTGGDIVRKAEDNSVDDLK